MERAIALFAGGLLAAVVVIEAWRGNLPTEISGRGVKYERLKDETRDALDALITAVAEDRRRIDDLAKHLAEDRRVLERLERAASGQSQGGRA